MTDVKELRVKSYEVSVGYRFLVLWFNCFHGA